MSSKKPVIQLVDGLKICDVIAECLIKAEDGKDIECINNIAELEGKIAEGWFDLTDQDLLENGYIPLELDDGSKHEIVRMINKNWIQKFKELAQFCDRKIQYIDKKIYGKDAKYASFERGRRSGINQIRKELEKLIKGVEE